MHSQQREEIILNLIRNRGFASFRELEEKIATSPATLRRDLDRLDTTGQIRRVRGGARAIEETPGAGRTALLGGVPFVENLGRNAVQKARIGAAAASLCQPGDAIIIDGGTTTLQMCRHLDELGLQVFTNSLHIVRALLDQPNTRVSVPAGSIFREQNIILSPYPDDGSAHFRATRMFLGAAGVGRHGVLQSDTLLLQAERRLFEQADELILMVDSSKFEATSGSLLCRLGEIDRVITDSGVSTTNLSMLEQAGVEVTVAA